MIKRERRTVICASRGVNRDIVGLIDSHTALPTRVEWTQTAALCFVRGDVSGANDAGRRNSWRVSLSLCLSFPSISSLDREETFLENSSGGQWASFLAWKRGESGAHAYECWRFEWYNIILYTHREKKEEENERRKEKDFCRKIE